VASLAHDAILPPQREKTVPAVLRRFPAKPFAAS